MQLKGTITKITAAEKGVYVDLENIEVADGFSIGTDRNLSKVTFLVSDNNIIPKLRVTKDCVFVVSESDNGYNLTNEEYNKLDKTISYNFENGVSATISTEIEIDFSFGKKYSFTI